MQGNLVVTTKAKDFHRVSIVFNLSPCLLLAHFVVGKLQMDLFSSSLPADDTVIVTYLQAPLIVSIDTSFQITDSLQLVYYS